jgi:hypothetical protein
MKNSNERTRRDVKLIFQFLKTTRLTDKFEISKNHIDIHENLLEFCSTFIKYHFLKKDQILFKEGIYYGLSR